LSLVSDKPGAASSQMSRDISILLPSNTPFEHLRLQNCGSKLELVLGHHESKSETHPS
jgi:hypothetical protein